MKESRPDVKITLRIILAMTLGLLSLSGRAAEPQAQPWPPKPDPASVAAIVRDLGLTPQEFEAYRIKERDAMQRFGVIRSALGDTWAGGYLHRREDNVFEIVVSTTDARLEQRARDLGADRVAVVRYSLSELEAGSEKLSQFLGTFGPEGLSSVAVNLPLNRIRVEVKRDREELIGKLAAAGNVPIELLVASSIDQLPELTTFYGGEAWWSPSLQSNGNYCSNGFAAYFANGWGMISAGHCFSGIGAGLNPAIAPTVTAGTWLTRQFGPLGDSGWAVINNSSYPAEAWVSTYSSGTYLAVVGNWEVPVNGVICKSGIASGYQCGYVLEKEVSTYYADVGVTVGRLTRSSTCVVGGDSGGSNVSPGGEAQGVTSGGVVTSPPCLPNSRTLFQPAQDILDQTVAAGYNVFLRTVYQDRRVTSGYQLGGTGMYALPNLFSPNGNYRLAVDNSNGWVTLFFQGSPNAYFKNVGVSGVLMMQTDGNVAARTSSGSLVWNLGISGAVNSGSEMRLADNGELQVYDRYGMLRKTHCIRFNVPNC